MTTNQTIDGVPRELLEAFVAYVADSPNAIMRARAKELRALLDREVITDDHLRQRIAFLTSEVHARANERDAAISELAEFKAAQPQGEPVLLVELVENKTYGGMHIAKWDNPVGLKEGFHKLYAEQPEPAAVVLPERKTVTEGLLSESNTHNQGWNACLDELKRLNQSL